MFIVLYLSHVTHKCVRVLLCNKIEIEIEIGWCSLDFSCFILVLRLLEYLLKIPFGMFDDFTVSNLFELSSCWCFLHNISCWMQTWKTFTIRFSTDKLMVDKNKGRCMYASMRQQPNKTKTLKNLDIKIGYSSYTFYCYVINWLFFLFLFLFIKI